MALGLSESAHESVTRCFVCWEQLSDSKAPQVDKSANLTENLSVVLLLRKVLGIQRNVIASFIEEFGSPSSWGVLYCSACFRMFRELTFLHKRLVKFHADFNSLSREVRDLILTSEVRENVEEEEDLSTSFNGKFPRKRRKIGRPARCKKRDADLTTETVPAKLRRKFVEENRENLLDVSETGLLTAESGICRKISTGSKHAAQLHQPLPSGTIFENKLHMEECEGEDVGDPEFTTSQHPQFVKSEYIIDSNHHDDDDDFLDDGTPMSEGENLNEEFEQAENEMLTRLINFGVEGEGGSDEDYNPAGKARRSAKAKKMMTAAARKEHHAMMLKSLEKVPTTLDLQPVANLGRYSCTECSKSFKKKFDCCIHILKAHHDDPMPYHCHVCAEKRFYSETYFRKHMTRYHCGAKSPYEDDYNPELHSAESLKKMIQVDVDTPSASQQVAEGSRDVQTNSGQQFFPNIPEEVMAKFRDSLTETFDCREPKCKKTFSCEMLRDGHEKRIHQGIEKAFSCDYCKRTFLRRTRLFEHLAKAHFTNQFTCGQCGSRFSEKVMLDGHVRRVHLGDITPFRCTFCPKGYRRRTKLNEHVRKQHGKAVSASRRKKVTSNMVVVPKITPEVNLECWVCHTDDGPLKFSNAAEKEEHMEMVHTGAKRPFKCEIEGCLKAYSTEGLLKRHVNKFHPKESAKTNAEFACSKCDDSFDSQQALDDHFANHEVSSYICTYCGQVFKEKYYLAHHEQQKHYKELNIKPHKCNLCGKVLNTAKILNHHKMIVHLKKPRYKCDKCNFGSMYPSALRNHVNSQHLKIKSSICPVCSQTFSHDFQLTNHMRKHTGEKPFKCIQCGKAFADRPTYSRHVEAHAGRIHACPIATCSKQFNTRHAFRIHLKQHQTKGDKVEIPEFRYETDEVVPQDDQKDSSSSMMVAAAAAEDSSFIAKRSTSPDLPFLSEPFSLASDQTAQSNSNSSTSAEVINGPIWKEDSSNDPEPPVLLPEAFPHST